MLTVASITLHIFYNKKVKKKIRLVLNLISAGVEVGDSHICLTSEQGDPLLPVLALKSHIPGIPLVPGKPGWPATLSPTPIQTMVVSLCRDPAAQI